MKNKFTFVASLLILTTFALGCSWLNPFSEKESSNNRGRNSSSGSQDKTITDKAVDTAVGEKKIGIAECDEVMDLITKEMNNPDDDVFTKTIKATIFNRIKDSIRENVEQNQSDPEELVKTCKELKIQFEKAKTEQEEKEANN